VEIRARSLSWDQLKVEFGREDSTGFGSVQRENR